MYFKCCVIFLFCSHNDFVKPSAYFFQNFSDDFIAVTFVSSKFLCNSLRSQREIFFLFSINYNLFRFIRFVLSTFEITNFINVWNCFFLLFTPSLKKKKNIGAAYGILLANPVLKIFIHVSWIQIKIKTSYKLINTSTHTHTTNRNKHYL